MSEIITVNKTEDISKSENIINPKIENNKSEFEHRIIEVYKILSGYYIKENKEKNLNIKLCEIEMRKALDICQKNSKINLNKNILDKISRIIHHNKINILLILSQIFIVLMQKETLFEKKSDINNIISFLNEICNLNKILQETYIGYKLHTISQKFIEKIISEFNFELEQISAIKNLINLNTQKMKSVKLKLNSFEEMSISLYDLLLNQESHLMQYKLIMDNFNYIIGMINQVDLDEKNSLENYIELGKIFAFLLYNKKYVIFLKKQSSESEGVIKLFFDGKENHYLFNIIEGEKFFIESEYEIEEMREKICELVLKYIEKYQGVNNIYEFQYVLYVLAKRVFFLFEGKFRNKIEPIIAEIMINLCFYKINSIEEIKIFIKEILKSDNDIYLNLKNLLQRKIDFIQMNPNFQLNKNNNSKKNSENYSTNIENISNEALFLLEGDLKLGYFLSRKIKNGEYFNFYVELKEPFSLLDFCANIEEYNIKLSIIDLTNDKYLIKNIEINAFSSPYKICLFFTRPVICKFIFDNTYSWIRDKNIKYKVNVFYPQKEFFIRKKILLFKYQEKLFRNKIIEGKVNDKKNIGKNLFLIKFKGINKAFNSLDVIRNIQTCDKLIENKNININSIYVSKSLNENNKSYFYFKKNNTLEKYELNKNNFENCIKDNILTNSNLEDIIEIVNIYIIKHISQNNNITDNNNPEFSPLLNIEDILGFIPDILDENNKLKILFFCQYLFQAQLLYYLFKCFHNKENKDIVLLINYSKNEGFQISQYKNGEIKLNIINLKNEENIEKNIEIICNEIKKYENKRKVDILINENIIDDKENEIDSDKLYQLIKSKLNMDEEENSFYICKLNKEFNDDMIKYSHIFYLD
jgi:hypothetical protein